MAKIDKDFWDKFYLDKNSQIKKIPAKIIKLEEKLKKADNKIVDFDFSDLFDNVLWIRLIDQYGLLVDEIIEEKRKLQK